MEVTKLHPGAYLYVDLNGQGTVVDLREMGDQGLGAFFEGRSDCVQIADLSGELQPLSRSDAAMHATDIRNSKRSA
jgi:hypothetical protein